jgi:tetratricopeptide (TPR) repeat protein
MHLYSTFGNPNFVGGYLIGTVFLALALAAASKARWARSLWCGFTLIMLAGIVETGSHGAWLGLAAGLAVVVMMVIPKGGCRVAEADKRTGNRSILMSVVPIACWLLVLLTLTLAQRAAAQLHGRIYLWRFSWPIFWQHPILGSGWGTYQLFYLEFQAKFLATHPEYVGYWTNNRLLHNDPLQVLLEAGLLGFAAFAWVLWGYAREVTRVWRQTANAWDRCAIAASAAGVTAILADSLFNYQFAVPPTYILLFTFLAFPALLSGNVAQPRSFGSAALSSEGQFCSCHEDRGSRTLRDVGPRYQVLAAPHKPWLLALKAAGSMAIIVAAGALLWQQTRVLTSERAYQAASDREDRGDLAGAEEAFRRSIRLCDLNGRAHFGLSRVLYSSNRFPEALQEIARAEVTYTDSHQEVLRARILDQMGRKSQALAAYRHALWLDPTLTSVQENIARLSKGP